MEESKRYECSFAEMKSLRLLPSDVKVLDLRFGAKLQPVKSWIDLFEYLWAKAKKAVLFKRDAATNSVQSLHWKKQYGALLKKKNELSDGVESATSDQILSICKDVLSIAEIPLGKVAIGYKFAVSNENDAPPPTVGNIDKDSNGKKGSFSYKYDSVRKIANTFPVSLVCKDVELPLYFNWINLAYSMFLLFESQCPQRFYNEVSKGRCKCLSVRNSGDRKALHLQYGTVYLAKGCSAENIVKDTRIMCSSFALPLDSVSVNYVSRIAEGETRQLIDLRSIPDFENLLKVADCGVERLWDKEKYNEYPGRGIGYGEILKLETSSSHISDVHLMQELGKFPYSLIFEGREYPLYCSWRILYGEFCGVVNALYPGVLHDMVDRGDISCLSISNEGMKKPFFLESVGLWLDKKSASKILFDEIHKLCTRIRIDAQNIEVKYISCRDGRLELFPQHPGYPEAVDRASNQSLSKESALGFYNDVSCRKKVDFISGGEALEKEETGGEQMKDPLPETDIRCPEKGSSPKARKEKPNQVGMTVDAEKAEKIKVVILENYSSGIVLNNASVALLEKALGEDIAEAELSAVKDEMFKRSDGTMFFPDMVMGGDARERMTARAGELISVYGFFAIDGLRSEFGCGLHNISEEKDFKDYLLYVMSGKVHCKVRGHEGWRMCFAGDMEEEDGWNAVAESVRGVLADSGDAVSVEDILAHLPFLCAEVIERVGDLWISDAVVLEADGVKYLKLLESFYLPEDFASVVKTVVRETESGNTVVSTVLLEAGLEERYGEGFRTNYGLDDDRLFKSVIAKSCNIESHEWKGDVFVSSESKSGTNVAEVFVRNRIEMFHEEDFFAFAKESRGFTNRGMLILTFLRRHCVRLSKKWWVSKAGFDHMFGLSDSDMKMIETALNEKVRNAHFMPISNLAQDFYDSLPKLEYDGKVFAWNPYLLTSVATLKLRNVLVVNDEPSPYTVTAFVAPVETGPIDDVISYVLNSFPSSYFKDEESAFEFLKTNKIRLARTAKLLTKIAHCIGR